MLKEKEDDRDRLELAARVHEAIKSLGRGGKRRIADRCGVSEQAITGWVKTGRIHKDNLLIVSDASGYELKWLITGTGKKLKYDDINGPQPTNNLADLMAAASPRTHKTLEAIEKAWQDGTLTEEDLKLLDAIARRLARDKSSTDR